MQFSSKSARRAPLFVVMALAALLLVPVSANAAMGGANPEVATLTPNLRSVTLTAVDTTNVTSTYTFCFDKPIGSLPNANSLRVGTYREFEKAGDSASRVGTSCAAAVYSSTPVDPIEQTYGHVLAGAVTNSANGIQNIADSSAAILPAGIGTNTGTANHHVAPTLTGCTVNNATQVATFTFDKLLAAANNNAGGTLFQLEDVNGNLRTSNANTDASAVSFSGNTVSVKFGTPAGAPPQPGTSTTIRCVVQPGAVVSLGDFAPNPTVQAATRPGNGGATNLPDLVSTTLAPDGAYIDYTYDEAIGAINTANAFHFTVSWGAVGTSAALADLAIVNNNTVRWTIPGGQAKQYNEEIVQGAADRGAVTGALAPPPCTQPPGCAYTTTSTEGHAPLGDNQGAYASGYTTAPEALRVTLDKTNGIANVLLDQRFFSFSGAGFRLIDDTGTVLPFSPVSVSGSGGPASQVTAKVTYTPAQVSGAANIQLTNGAVFDIFGHGNVDQVLSPTATARLVRRHGKVQWKHVTRHVRTKRLHLRKRNK
jgi:hypothetical protein